MQKLAFLQSISLCIFAACESAQRPEVQTSRPKARELPLPTEEASFHFVIFGDRTGGPAEGLQVLAQAVENTNLLAPDIVLTVGDLIQGNNETPQWLEQMAEYREIMDRLEMPWYPVAGNHDIYWPGSEAPPGHHEANYETHFGPLWYWFGHKNAAFIVLYTDEGDRATNKKGFRGKAGTQMMSPEQLAWLKATLAETVGYDHVFVFLHHPRWNTKVYPDSNWPETHRLLAEAGNVTAVFAGHRHRQRYDGIRDGITFYTLAATGGLMPMDVPGTGWLHHMNQVVVREDAIEVATIPVGVVLDPKEMTPDYLAEIDVARNMLPLPQGKPITLAADGSAQGELIYQLENKSTLPLEVSSTITSAISDWRVEPDQNQKTLQPGETAALRFALERSAGQDERGFSFPELTWQVHCLGERRRISLPESSRPVAVRASQKISVAETPAINHALSVDGAGARASFPPDRLTLPDSSFTLEAWMRADRLDGYRTIAGKTYDAEYTLMLRRGRPHFFVHLDGAYVFAGADSANAVTPGDWHHLAGVFDGQEVRLYIDGRLIDRKEAKGKRTLNDLPLLVGAAPKPIGVASFPFEGMIDELRLSTIARYEGESFIPSARHHADEATFLLLHLDGQNAPFVIDASPGARHGLISGGARFAKSRPTGRP